MAKFYLDLFIYLKASPPFRTNRLTTTSVTSSGFFQGTFRSEVTRTGRINRNPLFTLQTVSFDNFAACPPFIAHKLFYIGLFYSVRLHII